MAAGDGVHARRRRGRAGTAGACGADERACGGVVRGARAATTADGGCEAGARVGEGGVWVCACVCACGYASEPVAAHVVRATRGRRGPSGTAVTRAAV